MRIVHCLNQFLPGQVAGTEVYVHSLVKGLQAMGQVVTVVIPNYGEAADTSYEINGIQVIQYAESSVKDRELFMGRRKPDGLLHFGAVLQQLKPDIVHFHGLGGSNGITHFHVALAREMGYKIVFTFHIAGLSCFTGNLYYKDEIACNGYAEPLKCSRCVLAAKDISPLKKKLLNTMAAVAYKFGYNASNWQSAAGTAIGFPFIIQKLKKDLLRLAANADQLIVLTEWYRKVLLLNGLPAEKIIKLEQALAVQGADATTVIEKTDVMKIAFIGRVIFSKGLHLLIEAMCGLPGDKISLDIYGQVNEEGYAARCHEMARNNTNIQWRGIMEPAAVVQRLKQYDLLCVPSAICEMSPLVIQEAFAARIPVVASDVYGNAEQVTHGVNGWLFPFKDAKSLQQQLRQLMDDPLMLEGAKARIEQPRSFEKLVIEYLALYQDLTCKTEQAPPEISVAESL